MPRDPGIIPQHPTGRSATYGLLVGQTAARAAVFSLIRLPPPLRRWSFRKRQLHRDYFVPYARSPASPRPGTMNARSSSVSSIAAAQIGTSG